VLATVPAAALLPPLALVLALARLLVAPAMLPLAVARRVALLELVLALARVFVAVGDLTLVVRVAIPLQHSTAPALKHNPRAPCKQCDCCQHRRPRSRRSGLWHVHVRRGTRSLHTRSTPEATIHRHRYSDPADKRKAHRARAAGMSQAPNTAPRTKLQASAQASKIGSEWSAPPCTCTGQSLYRSSRPCTCRPSGNTSAAQHSTSTQNTTPGHHASNVTAASGREWPRAASHTTNKRTGSMRACRDATVSSTEHKGRDAQGSRTTRSLAGAHALQHVRAPHLLVHALASVFVAIAVQALVVIMVVAVLLFEDADCSTARRRQFGVQDMGRVAWHRARQTSSSTSALTPGEHEAAYTWHTGNAPRGCHA
jgi:hypothetical protein